MNRTTAFVVPAVAERNAGIYFLDSRLRGNDIGIAMLNLPACCRQVSAPIFSDPKTSSG